MTKYHITYQGKTYTLVPRLLLMPTIDNKMQLLPMPNIRIFCVADDGSESFVIRTVSFGEFIGIKNTAYLDFSSSPNAEAIFQLVRIAKDTGWRRGAGKERYPLWQFDGDTLRSLDRLPYQYYSMLFEKNVPKPAPSAYQITT